MSTDDDAIAAAKALERKAHLAHMMMQQPGELQANKMSKEEIAKKTDNNKNAPTRVGAVSVKNSTAVVRSAKSMSAKPIHSMVNSALSDLERKLSMGQQDLGDTSVVKKNEMGLTPGTATAVRTTQNNMQQALSDHERELLIKTSGGGGGVPTLGKATSMGVVLDHMICTTGIQSTETNNWKQQQLQEHESNALKKHRLPNEISSPEDVYIPYARSRSYHNEEPVDVPAAPLTAEVVDETKEREKITKEAQEALISSAVIATTVDHYPHKLLQSRLCGIVACVVLVLTAFVLGGVCGTGNCSSEPTHSTTTRAKAMAKFISSISSSETQLVYPFEGDVEDRSPEQKALDHLIFDDALRLSVISSGDDAKAKNWRLIQRYVLLVIWFTNGPWVGDQKAVPSAAASTHAWLVASDECAWSGVECIDGRIVKLNLAQRGLVGTVPKDMGLLRDLQVLDLEYNDLKGNLEETTSIFTSMGALVSLNLGINNFNGTIPELLIRFDSMKTLMLDNNLISGTIPESISSMTALEALHLGFNLDLTGTIPASLSTLTSLTLLGLGYTGLFASPPSGFFDKMKDLTYLELGGANNIIGEAHSLYELSGLSKLTHLSYQNGALLEGTIPPEVADWWPNITFLSLAQSNLTGTIPPSLAQWTQLDTIILISNQLTGSIPVSFYSSWSETLETLIIAYNKIEGSLPSELGLCSNLVTFDVRYNELSGSLPTTVGLLTSISFLFLSGNQLTGTIPTEVLNLPPGAFADYDSNDFTGAAPYCTVGSKLVAVKVDCLEVSCPCCSGCPN